MFPLNEPSIIIKPTPKIINIIQNHCIGRKNSSFDRCVIKAIPKGNKYKIISTSAISKKLIAWYVTAIKLTETKLVKIIFKNILLEKKIFCFLKIINGVNKINPIKHLEKSRTKRDAPLSKAIFAELGTIAKLIEDKITIKIPEKSLILSFSNKL